MKASLSFLFWMVLGGITWFSLVGRFDWQSMALGFPVIISAWALTEYMSNLKTGVKAREIPKVLKNFAGYVLLIVIPGFFRAPFFVARACLGGRTINPMVIAVPLPEASKESLLLLSLGLSMSPDQQVLAIDDERRILYVHAMHAEDPETLRLSFVDHYHRFVKEASP